MKKITLILFLTGALAASAQTPNYYLKSQGTNVPPLPVNTKPGYPVDQVAGKTIVDDTLSDAAVLTRGLWLMQTETEDGPPAPPGEGGGGGSAIDTNAWIGTWIHGVKGVQDPDTLLPASREPALWVIACTNNGGSHLTHQLNPWFGWTKVCPRDTVYVLWPQACASAKAGWDCFLITQQGTNSSGQYWTNSFLAKMDNPVHDPGNWAAWRIPDWPMTPSLAVTNPCIWRDTNDYYSVICTYLASDTNTPVQITNPAVVLSFICPDSLLANTGPLNIGDVEGVTNLYSLPNEPISTPITPPGSIGPEGGWERIDCGTPTLGFHWPRTRQIFPAGHCWACSDYYPDYVHQYDTETNGPAWFLRLLTHALPNHRYIVQSSTNLTTWAQEGTTNVLFGDEGVGTVILQRTNAPQEGRLFFRLQSVQ